MQRVVDEAEEAFSLNIALGIEVQVVARERLRGASSSIEHTVA
jgi:hypothetical protein